MAVWSVVRESALSGEMRIDAEFYQRRYLRVEQTLRTSNAVPLDSYLVDVRYGLNVPAEYVEGGLPFVRALNLKEYGIEGEILNIPYTSGQVGEDNLLQEGDLLIVRSGANVGDLGIVLGPLVGSTFGSYVIRMRVSGIDPYYLYAYLKSRFGREQTVRFRSGAAQPNISIPNLGQVLVLKPSEEDQQKIRDLVLSSYQGRTEAEAVYVRAENLLLHELGLDDLDLLPRTAYTATFREASAMRRLDAEYFQPKYRNLVEHVHSTRQAIRLGDWVSEGITRGVLPDYVEDGDICVINSRHVGATHVDLEDNRTTTWAFVESGRNRRALVQRYDVLLNSTGYITIGRCQTLLDKVDAVVDGHVSIIRPKPGLDPVYLGLYLNAPTGQLLTERGWTGSSGQIELRPDVIADYVVWKAPEDVQRRIRKLVEDAHRARQDARRLLDEAKQRVEEMVLGDE